MLLRRHRKQEQEIKNNVIDFDDMTVAELKKYATSKNIDLGEAAKKADILRIVKNA